MSIRSFIQHNFWLKIFSVTLALLIWFVIHFAIEKNFRIMPHSSGESAQATMRLPVRVLTQPGDSRALRVEPAEVRVAIAGQPALLRDLSPRDISAFVDLARSRNIKETNQVIRLDLPPGVSAVSIEPRTVNVEALQSQSLP